VLSPGRHATAVTYMYPLVESLEGRHTISASGDRPTVVESFLAGIYRRPVSVEATAFFGIQIDLTPLGAFALLGGGLDEFSDRTVPLDAALGSRGHRLIDRLGAASSWTERLEQTENALLALFEESSLPQREVQAAWNSIVSGRGGKAIQTVAAESGWSRAHLGRRMRRDLGITPKQLSRMVRFRHALNLVRRSGLALGEVALESGYSDQAHMSNEFREFTGRSPDSFREHPRRSHFSKTNGDQAT
jgi:AraC-like DNA-binding protein